MRIAYFDCFCGASGDMILAALLDAGAPLRALEEALAPLADPPVRLSVARVGTHGFKAARLTVSVPPSPAPPHRHLADIEDLLQALPLADRPRQRARAVFRRLAEAEARVHGIDVQEVHFHEVGALDAIADIVGTAVALETLGIDRVFASPLPLGSGTVRCEHGLLPVPAPATAELLRNVPVVGTDEPGELTTPTGAALLTTLAEGFGPLPAMTLCAVGAGTGHRETATRPNLLRVFVGERSGECDIDYVVVLETQVDDSSPEVIGWVLDRLLAAGALDAFATPVVMKKSRPATLITVLAEPPAADSLEQVLFAELPTLGVRRSEARRTRLRRRFEAVSLPGGTVRIKIGEIAGRVVTACPEFDDCRQLAERTGRPLREIQQLALARWHAARAADQRPDTTDKAT